MKLLLGLLVWPLLWLMRRWHLGELEMQRRARVAAILQRMKEMESRRQREMTQ